MASLRGNLAGDPGTCFEAIGAQVASIGHLLQEEFWPAKTQVLSGLNIQSCQDWGIIPWTAKLPFRRTRFN